MTSILGGVLVTAGLEGAMDDTTDRVEGDRNNAGRWEAVEVGIGSSGRFPGVLGVPGAVGGSGKGGGGKGAAAASTVPSTPPCTNRGCVAQAVRGHLDYLKLSIKAQSEVIKEFVEDELFLRHNLPLGWEEKGPAQRFQSILFGQSAVLYGPKLRAGDRTYCLLEFKGEGCALYQDEGLRAFLLALSAAGFAWKVLRVDYAWDGVAFGPDLMLKAARAGQFNSRKFNVADVWYAGDVLGQTTYLGHLRGESDGAFKKKDCQLKCYDMRGFNRLELLMKGERSELAGQELADSECDKWPVKFLGFLRRTVDFVDLTTGKRPDLAPLLPWWRDFVGGAGKVQRVSIPPVEHKGPGPTAWGIAEQRLQQVARRVLPIVDAVGWEYVRDRIERFGRSRLTATDEQFRDELRAMRGLMRGHGVEVNGEWFEDLPTDYDAGSEVLEGDEIPI